ncbi:MAG: endonuclease/exonuclease/phosphatase family protein [Nocardioides sp.]
MDPVEFLAAPPVPAGGSFTLAQANILTSLSPERFAEDLTIVTAARPDFITLNEAGGRSDEQIRPPGYSSWRGPSDSNWIRETPLLWRTDRWTALDVGTELMHNQPQFRGPKVTYGVRFANWATLRSVDGQTVSVISVHASPTYTPLRTLLIARLGVLVAQLSRSGPVLVGGDLNVHYLSRVYPRGQLAAAGLVSTFDSLGQPANGWATGTHNGATIDYLLATGAVQPISHNTYDLNSSDHRLLMGTFQTVG